MQDGDHDDAIFAEVIEEGLGKSAQKNAAKSAVRLMKRQRMPLIQTDRFIN
jgi:hypothetical protein